MTWESLATKSIPIHLFPDGPLVKYKPDAVMIGAGVRFNPALTTLFEMLVNLVRDHAPQARLCFNSGPYDTADAVERQT